MRSVPIRVISKNVRYATTTPFEGEELWTVRKDHLVNELRFNTLHNQSAFICCQEVLHQQLLDILSGLNEHEQWSYVGCGRDDGREAGEYSPIFYRPTVWDLIDDSTLWLSKTPDVAGSKYPGAGSVRILNTARFKHIETGIVVMVYCTHLDNVSSASREYSANLICERINKDSKFPLLLAGDFNSEPNQEAYQVISKSGLLHDVSKLPKDSHYGNSNTFTGFGSPEDPPTKIDYIFHSIPEASYQGPTFEVVDYAVLPNRFDDGIYNSDHRAVVVDLVLSSS